MMSPWKYRGLALIIVNKTFDRQSQDGRRGTEESKDVRRGAEERQDDRSGAEERQNDRRGAEESQDDRRRAEESKNDKIWAEERQDDRKGAAESKDVRRGADKDYRWMLYLFTVLDFVVKALIFRDLNIKDLNQKQDDIKSDSKLKDPECFVCVVSSHGKEIYDPKFDTRSPVFYTTDNYPFPVSKLVRHYSDWDAYTGKPKLFSSRVSDNAICTHMPQACRTKYKTIKQKKTKDEADDSDEESKKMYDDGMLMSVIDEGNSFNSGINDGARGRDKPDAIGSRPPVFQSTKQESACTGDIKSAAGSTEQDTERENTRVFDVPHASTSKQTPAGDMPLVPHDVSLIECPTDCLIMFPVVFGLAALRDAREEDNVGSWMLHYMFEERNKIIADGRLMPFLTAVADKIAHRDFVPDGHNTTTKCAAFIMHRLTKEVCFEPMRVDSKMAKQRNKLESP